eukprot:g3732.t1
MHPVLLLAACGSAAAARPVVYREATFEVRNESDIVYGQGLQCADAARTPSRCAAMDLMLDVGTPFAEGARAAAPRPAYIMMHGGGWKGGSKIDGWTQASRAYFASRGFVTFSIMYRLEKNNGTYPTSWPLVDRPAPGQRALRAAEYPATRDLKAAIRFVRANAARFGVDPQRIAIAGGSAGAISAIAAGNVDEDDYKMELLGADPTLQSTHLNTSSKVQCVTSHWGAGYGVDIVQGADPANRTRWGAGACPIVEFHGDSDTTVPYADALAVEVMYKSLNGSGALAYEMHTLSGCEHAAWCAGCGDQCGCTSAGPGWCHAMDEASLPFIARHLDLDLQGPSAAGAPASAAGPDPASRAKAMVARMNLTEKIAMLHGTALGYTGGIAGNARLGIPNVTLNDGPQGFRLRPGEYAGTTTSWPSGLTVGATFDRALAQQWGAGMGAEFAGKGAGVQLGPGVCLARVPRNGRNFEYLSGEDPYLGAQMVAPAVAGIQSQGVIANAKHWVVNNQETNRHGVTEQVDERTRFELYYPPFEGAIKAGVGSVMCSYNKIQASPTSPALWSCENPETLKRDLKERLNFTGWVMSDWGATHSMSINAGLDQEMPKAKFMNEENIRAAIANGSTTESAVDDSVGRILRPMFAAGFFDRPAPPADARAANVTSVEHNALARALAAASTVLLTNRDSALPLASGVRSIAVLGSAAEEQPVIHGNGSGHVDAPYVVTGLQGIREAAGAGTNVTHATEAQPGAAAQLAREADAAVVFVATVSGEGADRQNLSLPAAHDALVRAAARANKRTIVVVNTPGAVLLPWAGDVAAVLLAWMPGQEAGHAAADLLFGRVNPSGRLPITLPNTENEVGFTPSSYPGLPACPNKTCDNGQHANYSEGLEVGYRWYDAHGVAPAFAFGHGLSFTTFTYANVTASAAAVSVDVTNTGTTAGHEVAQLYLGFPASAGEPPQQLKGFEKVRLRAGETKTVTFALDERAFSVWDAAAHAWRVVEGEFSVAVGASSRDVRLKTTLSLP